MVKALRKKFRYGEKGFTLIELLVVVAVLGALAAVAIPNVGKFIGQGQEEAAETELHNIQTAVLALMADNNAAQLDAVYSGTDMSQVQVGGGAASLTEFLTGLDGTNTASGLSYDFTIDGTVSPTPAAP